VSFKQQQHALAAKELSLQGKHYAVAQWLALAHHLKSLLTTMKT